MNAPKVAIVILNYNTKNLLEKYLPRVLDTDYSNFEVVVADNASPDDSVEMMKSQFPEIKLIEMQENKGFAGGYNEALAQVQADYYLLLNSDVEVTTHFLEPLVKRSLSDDKIAAVQPKIRDLKHKDKFEYAGACGGFIDKYGYAFCRGRIFDELEIDQGQYQDACEIFWASGAALFIKASVYHEMGGLDEDFFAHQEEIDLCWRLQNAGYSIWVEPQSTVFHLGGGTLAEGSRKKTYLNYRNSLALLTKNLPQKKLFLTLFIRLILDGISSFRYILLGKPSYIFTIIKAHWHFFLDFGKHYKKRKQQKSFLWPTKSSYNHSIIWRYFVKRNRLYSELQNVS